MCRANSPQHSRQDLGLCFPPEVHIAFDSRTFNHFSVWCCRPQALVMKEDMVRAELPDGTAPEPDKFRGITLHRCAGGTLGQCGSQ